MNVNISEYISQYEFYGKFWVYFKYVMILIGVLLLIWMIFGRRKNHWEKGAGARIKNAGGFAVKMLAVVGWFAISFAGWWQVNTSNENAAMDLVSSVKSQSNVYFSKNDALKILETDNNDLSAINLMEVGDERVYQVWYKISDDGNLSFYYKVTNGSGNTVYTPIPSSSDNSYDLESYGSEIQED